MLQFPTFTLIFFCRHPFIFHSRSSRHHRLCSSHNPDLHEVYISTTPSVLRDKRLHPAFRHCSVALLFRNGRDNSGLHLCNRFYRMERAGVSQIARELPQLFASELLRCFYVGNRSNHPTGHRRGTKEHLGPDCHHYHVSGFDVFVHFVFGEYRRPAPVDHWQHPHAGGLAQIQDQARGRGYRLRALLFRSKNFTPHITNTLTKIVLERKRAN